MLNLQPYKTQKDLNLKLWRRDPAIPLPENTEESRKLLGARSSTKICWKLSFQLRKYILKSKDVIFSRTAYAKGINKETTTLDELPDHYNGANPDVVSIQMRNYCEKKGKEKVFQIFSS